MKLFSFFRKGKISKLEEDADLEHAYALMDRISNYIKHKDYLRASEGYVELEKLYKELKVGKGEIYKKCLELRHKLDALTKSPPIINIEVKEVVDKPDFEDRELSEEELLKYKKENETLHLELKELKEQLITRENVLEDLKKRIDNERKQSDETVKELKNEVDDLRDIKEKYEKEIKKIRDMYEKEIERLNIEIGRLETEKGSVEKPMFFEFFARSKKPEEEVSKADKGFNEGSKEEEKSSIKGILFSKFIAKKEKPKADIPKRSKVAEEVPEELPRLDFEKEIKVEETKDNGFRWVKIGIPGVDDLIVNGIPKGSSVLVAGGPGSGKTTLCLQTVNYGANNGERCLYLTFEEEKKNLVRHMKDFGWDPEKLEKKGLLIINKMDPFEISRNVEALLAKASGELMINLNEIEGIIPAGFKPDRIVLDSLSAVAAAFSGREEGYRIYIEQLFDLFKRIGATSFLITEIEQDTARYSRSGVEEFLADVVISMYNIRKGSVRVNAIEIIKIRGTDFKKKVVPFKMVSGVGIEVYPQEEIFA